jgi:hypothetical protein
MPESISSGSMINENHPVSGVVQRISHDAVGIPSANISEKSIHGSVSLDRALSWSPSSADVSAARGSFADVLIGWIYGSAGRCDASGGVG